ncbi:MAG: pectin acetylesterase-family hydrolase, partial [Myxococcota bacterium]
WFAVAGCGGPPILPVEAALEEVCPNWAPRVTPGPIDKDLHKVTLTDASSVCNDGSPPVLYVRPASDPDHRDDWVLFLQGGNHCEDYQTCAARWCGTGYYEATRMSTRWTQPTIAGAGIASTDPRSPFAGWNQVTFYYCSSDKWSGTNSQVVLDGPHPFRLEFQGSRILDDGLAALSGDGLASDDGVVSLGGLDRAKTGVFAGSSAGGQGAAINLDRVAGMLPNAEVLGIPDALFDPDEATLTAADAAAVRATADASHDLQLRTWWPVLDASCVEANGIASSACDDLVNVMRNFTETPVLTHHDAFDPTYFGSPFSAVITFEEYAQSAVDTYGAWRADGDPGSAFLTACNGHEFLTQDDRFLDVSTIDAATGAGPVTFGELAAAFVGGERGRFVLDDAQGSGSTCPTEPDVQTENQ